jgi:guanylate kinase
MKVIPKSYFNLNDILNTASDACATQIQEAINVIAPNESVNNLCFKPLLGGVSKAQVFQFDVKNKKYVLRLLDEHEPIDRRLSELSAHKIGVELRIAPTLFYHTDKNPLVLVMEFIEGRLFSRNDLNNREIITKVMQAIKKFHCYASKEHLLQRTRVDVIQDLYDHSRLKNDAVFPSCFDRLHKKLQLDHANLKTQPLPSHGDLNPDNILIAEDGNIYLIDWTEASIDNPFLDIGWLSCFSAANNDHVKNLLREYLGRNPNESEVKETLFFRDVTIFYIATYWLGFQEEKNQDTLDALLATPLKKSSEKIINGMARKESYQKRGFDLTIHALEWLKEFISNQNLRNSSYNLLYHYNAEQTNWRTNIKQATIRVKNQFNKYGVMNLPQTFLLILGVSGAGKSTIIRHLKQLDHRIIPVIPYTTRPLRPQEYDKFSISTQEMEQLEQQGNNFIIDKRYGIVYATPQASIETTLHNGQIPILDWPISKLNVMQNIFGERLFCVYVAPPDLETLKARLANDGRDKDGSRLKLAQEELDLFSQGAFDHLIHKLIINHDGNAELYAREIFDEINNRQTSEQALQDWQIPLIQ